MLWLCHYYFYYYFKIAMHCSFKSPINQLIVCHLTPSYPEKEKNDLWNNHHSIFKYLLLLVCKYMCLVRLFFKKDSVILKSLYRYIYAVKKCFILYFCFCYFFWWSSFFLKIGLHTGKVILEFAELFYSLEKCWV